MVQTQTITLSTKGNADIYDITDYVKNVLASGKINSGLVNVCVVGSTSAVTTCEYEPGLVKDIKELFDKIIPSGNYNHDQAWGDGNGHSHLRSSLLGPSITLPFNNKKMILGTWQQIIFIDFDNRPRQREITVQVIGD